MAITRRQFLERGAALAAGLTLSPQLRPIPGTNVAWAAAPVDPILVIVQLFGGNDGLNTVYPLTGTQRALYEEFRPTLKLPDTAAGLTAWSSQGFDVTQVLSLGTNPDGEVYALHPAMGALHDLYEQGKVAVASGVHYPFPNHSHFRSEEIWYTVDPLGAGRQGWLGAYLSSVGFGLADVPGVLLGHEVNPIFQPTDANLFAFRHLSNLAYPAIGDPDVMKPRARTLYVESGTVDPLLLPELARLGQSGAATLDKMGEYFQPGNGLGNAAPVEALLLDADGRYGRSNPLVWDSPLNFSAAPEKVGRRLARDLRHVAAVIRADVGARFFHVGIGGFDTHSSQEKGLFHSFLLQEISDTIAAFYDELGQVISLPAGYNGYQTGSLASRVLVVTLSEFGRTIRQNAQSASSAGTDHAASSVQFVVGENVIGGQYGAYPALDDPRASKKNDLKTVLDIRDFYGTILQRWLGVPLAELDPGPGKLLPATPEVDEDGRSYTSFSPIGFLAP